MARFTDTDRRKRILAGDEVLPLSDSGDVKGTSVTDLKDYVQKEIGESQINLSTDPVAFSRAFEADGDFVKGEAMTLYRDGSAYKARKINSGNIVQQGSTNDNAEAIQAFNDLDFDLSSIVWDPTEADRDMQLNTGSTKFFVDVDKMHIRINSNTSVKNDSVFFKVFKLEGNRIAIHGIAQVSRFLSLSVENDPTTKENRISGSSILYASDRTESTSFYSAYVVILERKSTGWECVEAVGLSPAIVKKTKDTVNGLDAQAGGELYTNWPSTSIHAGRCIKDKIFSVVFQSSNNYLGSSYSKAIVRSKKSGLSSGYEFARSDTENSVKVYYEITDDFKVKYFLFNDKQNSTYFHNWFSKTNAELDSQNLSDWQKSIYNSSYPFFAKLPDDLSGERWFFSSGSSYNLILRINFAEISGFKTISSFGVGEFYGIGDFSSVGYYAASNANSFSTTVVSLEYIPSSEGGYLKSFLNRDSTGNGTIGIIPLNSDQTKLIPIRNTSLDRDWTDREVQESVSNRFKYYAIADFSVDYFNIYDPLKQLSDILLNSKTFNGEALYSTSSYIDVYPYHLSERNSGSSLFLERDRSRAASERLTPTSVVQHTVCASAQLGTLGGNVLLYAYRETGKEEWRLKAHVATTSEGSQVVINTSPNKLLGFAAEDVTDGATGSFVFAAQGTILNVFSGLRPGNRYWWGGSGNSLNVDGNGQFVGLAISPTEIVVGRI